MAVVFPYTRAATWADGSTTDTAAKRNTMEDGIFNAHQQPAVRVTHNTTQAITNSTDTVLAFNTERFDQAGGAASTQHDTVTNNSRLTCRYAGVYLVTANASWSALQVNARIQIRLNGTTVIAGQNVAAASTGDYRDMNLTTIYALAVNDYVEVLVRQISGGSLNITNNANYSPEFMMVRVA